jgi:hypothetical protein
VLLAETVTGRSFDHREMIAQRPQARRADEIQTGDVHATSRARLKPSSTIGGRRASS